MDISVVFAQMVQYGVATEHLYKLWERDKIMSNVNR